MEIKNKKNDKKILPPALALLAGFAISFIATITTSAASRLVSKGTVRVENAGELLLITAQDFTTLSEAIQDASVRANVLALERVIGSIEPMGDAPRVDGEYAWKNDSSGEPRIYRYSAAAGDYLIIGGLANAIDYVAQQLVEAENEKEKSKEKLMEAIAQADPDVRVKEHSYRGISSAIEDLSKERYKDGTNSVLRGTASAADVAAGATFVNTAGDATGTMTTITALASGGPLKAGESMSIAAGYYPNPLTIKALSLSSQTAARLSANAMMKGASAWANGNLINGAIETKANPNYKIKTASTENVISAAGYYAGGITVDASAVYNSGKDAGKVDGERDGYEDGYEENKLPRTIYTGGITSQASWDQPGMELVYDESGNPWWDVQPTTGYGNHINVETSAIELISGAYVTAPVKMKSSSERNASIDDPILTIRIEIRDDAGNVLASSNTDTIQVPDGLTRGKINIFFYVEAESRAGDPAGGVAHVEGTLGDVYMHY